MTIGRWSTFRSRAGAALGRRKLVKWVVTPVVILALIYLAVSFYIVDSALDAEANPLEERPEDFALQYEDVEFSPRGWPSLTLRGWWMPAPDARATLIRVHGIDSNRSSALGTVPALVESGYSVLVIRPARPWRIRPGPDGVPGFTRGTTCSARSIS